VVHFLRQEASMPLGKKTMDRIYETVCHLSSHKNIKWFKFGITRNSLRKRFYPHKKLERYEHIVALAVNLNCDDALKLEKDLHGWAAYEAKTSRGDKDVYKKYVHQDEPFKYSHGPGRKAKSQNHSVYMVWQERG
jgi:hypothetical protein